MTLLKKKIICAHSQSHTLCEMINIVNRGFGRRVTNCPSTELGHSPAVYSILQAIQRVFVWTSGPTWYSYVFVFFQGDDVTCFQVQNLLNLTLGYLIGVIEQPPMNSIVIPSCNCCPTRHHFGCVKMTSNCQIPANQDWAEIYCSWSHPQSLVSIRHDKESRTKLGPLWWIIAVLKPHSKSQVNSCG